MYTIEYSTRTGKLNVEGDHADIDQALYEARLDITRKKYRSGHVPVTGLRVTENSGAPVDVEITYLGEYILTAFLKMTISPVLNPPFRAESQRRVMSITTILEEHARIPRMRTIQQLL